MFNDLFGYNSVRDECLLSFVEQAVAADLEDLTVSQLQAHALELQQAGGRLAGRAGQVLAAVHARSGGQVLESSLQPPVDQKAAAADAPAPSGLPLLMSVQAWWREATRVAGTMAGRQVCRAGVLARFRVWGQAVTDGLLTPAQGGCCAGWTASSLTPSSWRRNASWSPSPQRLTRWSLLSGCGT